MATAVPSRISILVLATALVGCTGSRWAKDDPDYAAKYPHHTDDWGRTIKQAVDARHLVRKGGGYATLNGRDEPTAMGAEAGIFRYQNPYTEGRVGLAGLIYEGDAPVTGGILAAARLQTPTRLAPFAGMGVYAGFSPEDIVFGDDGIDNDSDSYVDESDEINDEFVFAFVPEAGCHFWLNPGWRFTGSASYYVTGNDTDDNFLLFGVSLACLTDLGLVTSPDTLRKQAADKGWKIGDGLTPSSVTTTNYNAPSEPLDLPATPQQLNETTVELLPGDKTYRPTAYDALPSTSSL